MRNIVTILFLILFIHHSAVSQDGIKEKKKAIKAHNKAVHLMDDWMRDPYIVLAPDGYYYLSATRPRSAFPETPFIQLYRSRDLVQWEDLGPLWTAEDTPYGKRLLQEAGQQNKPGIIWAPEMHYVDGKWVIVNLSNAGVSNLMLTEGKKLQGPFIEPFDPGRRHDPSLFVDDDGSRWLIYGFYASYIQKLKPDFSGYDGERITIGPSDRGLGHEGLQIIKVDEKYVLLGTGWSTDTLRHGTYNQYYCTADKLTGPYGPRKFAGRFLGHGTMFKDKQGKWWCTAFYNADTPTITPEKAKAEKLDDTAYTINEQGLTIVPVDIRIVNGDVEITTLDPDYASPGKEEVQQFDK